PSFNAIASTEPLSGSYAIVLIKIPKTLALLEQQLSSLNQHINSDTIIIAAGMTKNIHSSTLALFEKHLGETTTSRATKKARLIFCKVDNKIISSQAASSSALTTTRYFADPLDCELISYANGFSRDRLDLGARAMMQAMNENNLPDAENIADLACGNGVLGLHALNAIGKDINKADKQRCITFIDESYMAVAAATENYQHVISNAAKHNIAPIFVVQDSIQKPDTHYDWIICNPPFHIGTAMDTYIANRMFQQSFIALQRNGQLWVVANRHLKYENQIKKVFKNAKIVLSNKKFVVIAATKM
ncbi:MAG: methyltransferase, partial [Cellvibrionales bacterium]|nr:methyltransferase [Cellvibrionales bacterium]